MDTGDVPKAGSVWGVKFFAHLFPRRRPSNVSCLIKHRENFVGNFAMQLLVRLYSVNWKGFGREQPWPN
jgi:hypothetical protein